MAINPAVTASPYYPSHDASYQNNSEETSSEKSAENVMTNVPDTVTVNTMPRSYPQSAPNNLPFGFSLCLLRRVADQSKKMINVNYEVYVISEENLDAVKKGKITEFRVNSIDTLNNLDVANEAVKSNRIVVLLMNLKTFEYCAVLQRRLSNVEIERISRIVVTNMLSLFDVEPKHQKIVNLIDGVKARKALNVNFSTGNFNIIDSSIYKTSDVFEAANCQVLVNSNISSNERWNQRTLVNQNVISNLKDCRKQEAKETVELMVAYDTLNGNYGSSPYMYKSAVKDAYKDGGCSIQ